MIILNYFTEALSKMITDNYFKEIIMNIGLENDLRKIR